MDGVNAPIGERSRSAGERVIEQPMQIEGSVRANMLAAIASARRWRGRQVHQDTVDHWRQLLEHGRRVSTHQPGELLGDVVAELEAELRLASQREGPNNNRI